MFLLLVTILTLVSFSLTKYKRISVGLGALLQLIQLRKVVLVAFELITFRNECFKVVISAKIQIKKKKVLQSRYTWELPVIISAKVSRSVEDR